MVRALRCFSTVDAVAEFNKADHYFVDKSTGIMLDYFYYARFTIRFELVIKILNEHTQCLVS